MRWERAHTRARTERNIEGRIKYKYSPLKITVLSNHVSILG
jgi:hypothetical protein